jgi:Ran GTPase-activating protein (RanGAP) involved in mRNA processing and transport
MLTDAKDVYARAIDIKGQVTRQKRRIQILQDEFDATPVDQNRRIGRHVEAAKGRLHLLNVSLEEAEEKLIEVSLPHALVLMRELELQLGRLEAELVQWQEKFNKTGNGKFKNRRDDTQERIDLIQEALEIARMHQSVKNIEYYEYWEERVEWLLESEFKHALKHLDSFNLKLDRTFAEVERMEKHLHADKQQGVFHKVLLVIKYLQLRPQVQYINLSVNKKIGNWVNLLFGAVLNETPPHIVAARAIVRAKQKAETDSSAIAAEHDNTPEQKAQLSIEDGTEAPHSPVPASPKLTKTMQKMELPPMARVHTLDVSRCFVEDGSVEALSQSLKENYSLTSLKAANNAFTYIGIGHLANAMRKNQTLTHLDLSGNDLTKSGTDHRRFEAFTSACGAWVESLRLRNCSIYFRGTLALPMLKPHSLRTLDLSCNYLTDEGAFILSESFFSIQRNLKRCSLSECYIRNEGFLALMSVLVDKKSRPLSLEHFDLTHNTITDPGIAGLAGTIIPQILEASGDDDDDLIRFLALKNNYFTPAVGKTLADALVKCPYFSTVVQLEATGGSTCGPLGGCITPRAIIDAEDTLQLNDLALGDMCGAVVAQMFLHNDKITHLNLARNRFSLETGSRIAEAILDHGTINGLDLSCNNINLKDPILNGKFFSTITKCKNLRSLKLDRNGIGHDGFWSIVSFLGGNPPLESLSIQGNDFGVKRAFDILLNNLKLNKTLMWLDLRYNPYLLNELVMTGDGYGMIAHQINRVCSDLIVPPFHDIDMEIPELAAPDEQIYLHKFRERMLKTIRERINQPGEMDQASSIWMGRHGPELVEEVQHGKK